MSKGKVKLVGLIIILVLGIILVAVGLAMVMPWGAYGRYSLIMRSMIGYGLRFGFMMFIPIIFLALIVLGAYFAITELSKPSGRGEAGALEILKERYAKGEITREEYLKMKEELG
jgi:putative membrane protein